MSERIAILGASRGLGRALTMELSKVHGVEKMVLFARSAMDKEELFRESMAPKVVYQSADFSSESSIPAVFDFLSENNVTRLIYVAGGGPFGFFGAKQWKDHQWALEVNFLFPSRLLHKILGSQKARSVGQFIYVGSAIAENKSEPKGASYAAAKLAMKGLITSVQSEIGAGNQSLPDLRLYSPGFMDTGLLPKNAPPRQSGAKILDPGDVAVDLITWMLDDSARLTNRVFAD